MVENRHARRRTVRSRSSRALRPFRKNGAIRKDGTHETLIEKNGNYARLDDLQFENGKETRR